MIVNYYGPFIYISFKANELSDGHVSVQLADGYSYERIFINSKYNVTELIPYMTINEGYHITFPVINSKSPSVIPLYVLDLSKEANIRLTIEKFGQIPDPNYFRKKAYDPILVTGDDGKTYPVIPSTQFK